MSLLTNTVQTSIITNPSYMVKERVDLKIKKIASQVKTTTQIQGYGYYGGNESRESSSELWGFLRVAASYIINTISLQQRVQRLLSRGIRHA